MSQRPRVTASHTTDALTIANLSGDHHTTPGVEVRVDFDLHDHEAALAALETAVADVRRQIEETA